MSDSGFKELDLDNLGKTSKEEATDIEIVHEGLDNSAAEVAQEPEVPAKAAVEPEADDEDDDSSPETAPSERKKLTRSQRLKAQRDAYARQLTETQERLTQAEERAKKFEQDANDGAAIGFDLYAKSIDASLQALRRDFDQAFDSGDREKIFEVQQKMASLAAEKQQIERDRRSIPTKPTQQSGSDTPQQTRQTPAEAKRRAPSPAAVEWYERNKTWFNKDSVMTAGAQVIDRQMVADGYQPDDPDYFDELDKRLKTEFPAKLGARPTARPAAANPTIQNRAAPSASLGKVRVTITQADREMASHLGISVEDYAREKARAERAQQTVSQYTEIV
jgi:hypothetical protein